MISALQCDFLSPVSTRNHSPSLKPVAGGATDDPGQTSSAITGRCGENRCQDRRRSPRSSRPLVTVDFPEVPACSGNAPVPGRCVRNEGEDGCETCNNLTSHRNPFAAAQVVQAGAGQTLPAPLVEAWGLPGAPVVPTATWELSIAADRERNMREHLLPALQAYILTRNLCPLSPEPHMRIADYILAFARADARAAYLYRAKQLKSTDPGLWFMAGVQELIDGQRGRATQSWQRSLGAFGPAPH